MRPFLSAALPNFNDITSDLHSAEIVITTNIVWVMLSIQVIASYLCYIFSKFACKIHIQIFSFSIPINLTVPLTISTLIVLCGLRQSEVCAYHDVLPDHSFFHMPPIHSLFSYVFKQFVWIWVIWILAQVWLTRHLWHPKNLRNASTERLFVLPMYDGLLVDQSLILNRRREEFGEFVQESVSCEHEIPPQRKTLTQSTCFQDDKRFELGAETLNEIDRKYLESNSSKEGVTARDHIPQIYVCATMWHETKEELVEFLKSIMRLDEDQCARRMAMRYIQLDKNEIDKDYYDLEGELELRY